MYNIDDVTLCFYITMLKSLKKGNKVTIPYNVYTCFMIMIRNGILENNPDCTKYKYIAVIRFRGDSTDCLSAIVEVVEEKEVTIEILKEYGELIITDSEMQKI